MKSQNTNIIRSTNHIINCPKCRTVILTLKKGIYYCKKCSTSYPMMKGIPLITEQNLIDSFRKEKPNWYVTSQKTVRDIYKYQHALMKKMLTDSVNSAFKSIHKQNIILLDIGCGDGRSLKDIADMKLSIKLYGCDYNFIRLVRAKKLVPSATLFLNDVNNDAITKNSCDIILLNHVIEHVKDDVGLLRKIYSYLRPGGVLILGTPQEGTFLCRLRNYVLEPYIMFKTDHVQFYTDKKLLAKIKKTKFTVESFEYYNYHFPHSILDRYIRKSKRIHDFMERNGHKYMKRAGAGGLWLIVRKK